MILVGRIIYIGIMYHSIHLSDRVSFSLLLPLLVRPRNSRLNSIPRGQVAHHEKKIGHTPASLLQLKERFDFDFLYLFTCLARFHDFGLFS